MTLALAGLKRSPKLNPPDPAQRQGFFYELNMDYRDILIGFAKRSSSNADTEGDLGLAETKQSIAEVNIW